MRVRLYSQCFDNYLNGCLLKCLVFTISDFSHHLHSKNTIPKKYSLRFFGIVYFIQAALVRKWERH